MAFLAFGLTHLEGFRWDPDEGIYLMWARLMYAGHPLYTQVWSDQTPGLPTLLTGLFHLLGPSVDAGRALIVVIVGIGLFSTGLIAYALGGRWAILAGPVVLLIAPNLFRLSRAIMGTLPAMCLATLALAMGLLYLQAGRRRWLVLAGLSLAASILIKPITAYAIAPLGLAVVWRERPGGWQSGWREIGLEAALLLVATALPLAGVMMAFDANAFWQQVLGTYFGSRSAFAYDPVANGRAIWRYLGENNLGLVALAGVGTLWWVTRHGRQGVWLLAWLVITLVVMITQAPLFPWQHLVPLLFPLAVGAGLMLDALWTNSASRHPALRSKPRLQRLAWITSGSLALLLYLTGLPATLRADAALLQVRGDVQQAEAVQFIRAITRPEEIIISDDQMIAFRANRLVPPALGDTSGKRLEAGNLPAAAMIRLTEQYRPAAILIWDVRLIGLPEYVRWVEEHYQLALAFSDQRRIYVRPDGPATLTPVKANADNQLNLVGYTLDSTEVESGGMLYAVLQWQAQTQPAENYTAFLHLKDSQGNTWGIRDQPLLDPARGGTSAWEPDFKDLESTYLQVWPGTPPGTYTLWVGLYAAGDQTRRLNWRGLDGASLGTTFPLATIQVRTPRNPTQGFERRPIPHPLNPQPRFADQISLLGYEGGLETAKPGEQIPVTIYWQALQSPKEDVAVRFQVRDQADQVWEGGTWPLAGPNYPTTRWPARSIVAGRYAFLLPGDVAPGPAQVEVLPVNAAQTNPQPIPLFQVNVAGILRTFEVPPMSHQVNAHLDNKIKLLGYDLEPAHGVVSPGGTLRLVLYWQAQAPIATSYTVFTHVLDDQAHIWGQVDQLPASGARPTTGWVAGEVIADATVLALPSTTPPGEQVIEVGLYDPTTGQRLPAFDQRGQRLEQDRILLGRVHVIRR